jgi:hypothetical protein
MQLTTSNENVFGMKVLVGSVLESQLTVDSNELIDW